MYAHHTPNHLETEDKFILNLSMRQCVILFVAATLGYMLFNDIFNAVPASAAGFGLTLGIIAALLTFLGGVALALIRVYHRGLDEWMFVIALYALMPKTYLWHFNKPDVFESLDFSALANVKKKRHRKKEENEW